jgi:Fanconi-associated nuclease 1
MDERFSLAPGYQPPVTAFARDETTLGLDEIMSCISADELRKVAKARKVPNNMLQRREDVCSALRGVARKQTVLGFAPVRSKQSTLPFGTAGPTSESLLIAQLLPLISMHALQLSPEIHTLIARVNLIFSRTPPLTATASSLMLPSILVTSHRRRYPDYGQPTRSVIWSSRDELLGWERAVHWEAVVGDALGDSWQEQRKAPQPGFAQKPMLSRVEGARVVKRIWEGVWPVWTELVKGKGGEAVDVKEQSGGLVGDRFKAGESKTMPR